MMTDAEIRLRGIEALSDSLGVVEAERFVALVKRDQFDYTEWRKDLFNDLSVKDLSSAAADHYSKKQGTLKESET